MKKNLFFWSFCFHYLAIASAIAGFDFHLGVWEFGSLRRLGVSIELKEEGGRPALDFCLVVIVVLVLVMYTTC